jgi:DNA-binding transcriptional ArsR family regulator
MLSEVVKRRNLQPPPFLPYSLNVVELEFSEVHIQDAAYPTVGERRYGPYSEVPRSCILSGVARLTSRIFNCYIEFVNNTEHREFKDHIFEQFARIGKALSHPKRLEIIDVLAQAERTVEQVAKETAIPVANASQHLQVLRGARMVEVRREGLYAYYRLADEGVFRAWRAVRDLGEARLAEVDRVVETYLKDRGGMEAVDAAGLMQRLADGSVVVLDVRPEEEYRAGHVLGARGLPGSGPSGPPRGQGDRRLLPWPLLCLFRRGSTVAASPRFQGSAPQRRLPRVAGRGLPDRG